MQQNYFLTPKPTSNARGTATNMRKLFSPSGMDFNKPSIQTEPDFEAKELRNEYKHQKVHLLTEEDEQPRSKYLPAKPKSFSINTTPRVNGLRTLQATPHPTIDLSKHGFIQDGKYKAIRRGPTSESQSPFDTFMKRLNKLQTNAELPNSEPVKHSEKSYGVIKAFGICTNQGLVRNYNEDRVSIVLNIVKPDEPKAPPCCIFSLFDGHGGSKCADFLRNNLHNQIVKSKHFSLNIQEALRDAFEQTEKIFIEESLSASPGYEKSGSCALVMVIIEDTCYVCNLGDSRAVMSQDFGKTVYALTRDHKPDDKQEQKRIIAAGGKIYQRNSNNSGEQNFGLEIDIALQKVSLPLRILPGKLSVSRAFGDVEAKIPQLGGNPSVLISKPEITKLKLRDEHDFILLGCDGIFDRLSNEEVIGAIWDTVNKKGTTSVHDLLGHMAESTVKAALLSKSFDNVTAIIVSFGNIESAFNRKKNINPNSFAQLEPGVSMTPRISNTGMMNNLTKSAQFSLGNLAGTDRSHLPKKDAHLLNLKG